MDNDEWLYLCAKALMKLGGLSRDEAECYAEECLARIEGDTSKDPVEAAQLEADSWV